MPLTCLAAGRRSARGAKVEAHRREGDYGEASEDERRAAHRAAAGHAATRQPAKQAPPSSPYSGSRRDRDSLRRSDTGHKQTRPLGKVVLVRSYVEHEVCWESMARVPYKALSC